MSPTILTEAGYRFIIYLNDHPPAHVHVKKAGSEARVKLEAAEIVSNFGFSNRDLQRIITLVEAHQVLLLEAWDEYHESR